MNSTIVVVIILMAILFLLAKPLRILRALLTNVVIGVSLLFLVNIIGNSYGLHVNINEYTAGTVSLLGIPGVAAIFIIQNWII